MKIVAVLGSPTRDGNTCILAREVLRGAREHGATTQEIFLAEHGIEYCRGCISRGCTKTCMASGECVIDDDVNELRRQLYESDGIVLASPSYGLMPTARMKNFLTDRIGMFTVYASALAGRYFVGVSTCGGIGANKVARDLAGSFAVGFHERAYVSGAIGATLGDQRIESRPEVLERAYRLGAKLAEDIESDRGYPFQKLPRRLMTYLVVRPIILRNILAHKESSMKAVYENLVARKLI